MSSISHKARNQLLVLKKHSFSLLYIGTTLSLALASFIDLCRTYGIRQRELFFRANDSFMDFFNVMKYIADRNPYNNTFLSLGEKAYPPITYLIMYPFSRLYDYVNSESPRAAASEVLGIMSFLIPLLLLCIAFFILLYEFKNGSRLISFLCSLSLFLSGIFLFSIERGNIIFLSVVCCLYFVMFYKSERKVLKELAYIALALAAALKIYPVLLGLLLLFEKDFKGAVRSAVYFILLFFLPFLFFDGGFSNIPLLLRNVSYNTSAYLLANPYYRFGPIQFGLLFGIDSQTALTISQLLYIPAAIVVVSTWSLKQDWKRVLLIVTCILITPVNSAFYNGLYLFIPFIMFLNAQEHSKWDFVYLIAFIIIFNPFQIYIGGQTVSAFMSNAVLMLLYLALCLECLITLFMKLKNKQLRKLIS